MLKYSDLLSLTAIPTISSSTIFKDRLIMSICPLVIGSNEPGYKPETRTNDVSEFSTICDTFVEKPEYEDCGLMFANTGFYPDKYNNQWEATEFSKGISVFINRDESSEIDIPLEVMFLDDSIVNGAIGNDYSSKVVDGEWFSDEFEQTSKQIILSRETASKLDLGVGKTIDLTFAYACDIEEKNTLTNHFFEIF